MAKGIEPGYPPASCWSDSETVGTPVRPGPSVEFISRPCWRSRASARNRLTRRIRRPVSDLRAIELHDVRASRGRITGSAPAVARRNQMRRPAHAKPAKPANPGARRFEPPWSAGHTCVCGRDRVLMPITLLSEGAVRGKTTILELKKRLRCRGCKQRPAHVWIDRRKD